MIAKNPVIPNKKSWFRWFLSRLKVFFSSPPCGKFVSRAVIQLGGIRPHPDYPDLPRWCKRLRGQGLDVIRTELCSMGWITAEDSNQFYEKLKEVENDKNEGIRSCSLFRWV